MDALRDADMMALEEKLSTFGKQPELLTAATRRHLSWWQGSSGSSVSTLQGSSYPSSSFSIGLEGAIEQTQCHGVQIQPDLNEPEALPLYNKLPDVKKLARFRYMIMSVYRRLFSLVFLGNLAAFIWVIIEDQMPLNLINAATANILALGLARQPLVINLLFRVFGAIPRSAPLRLRRLCAKIYCYGGVHSGCGIASLMWYIGFIVLLTRSFVLERQTTKELERPSVIRLAMIVLSYVVLVLLLAIIIAAHPKIRFMLHDWFELTHRFCGWVVVVLFWPLLILASRAEAHQTRRTMACNLVRFPAFWMLIIITVAIIHPWVLLRRVKVNAEQISSHAIRLHFQHTSVRFGHAIQLSKHPLRDWHSFATFPDIPSHPSIKSSIHKDPEFSCLVSKAGDWTSDAISNPPTVLWKRGIPIYGFAHMMRIFSRLIVVTTGSGIGPSLSFLLDPNRPAVRVIWQAKSPLNTYGQPILDMLHQLDADPVILDTIHTGRVGMLPLMARLISEFDAEAVCIISNPMVTRTLVFECESRGIPAYGAIFDS